MSCRYRENNPVFSRVMAAGFSSDINDCTVVPSPIASLADISTYREKGTINVAKTIHRPFDFVDGVNYSRFTFCLNGRKGVCFR